MKNGRYIMAEPFNARLQRLLSNSGMTQKELAAQAGVTEAAVSHYIVVP